MSSSIPQIGLGLCLLLLPLAVAFFHGPPNGGGPFGPPSFLRNVSSSARRQFFQLVSSPNGTKAQIQSELSGWAQSNGVLAAYQDFTQKCQQNSQQMHANISNWLAGDALELFNELWTVRQNMQISRLAECEQIRQLLNESSQSQPALRLVVPIPPSPIFGPPPRACFPHFMGPSGQGPRRLFGGGHVGNDSPSMASSAGRNSAANDFGGGHLPVNGTAMDTEEEDVEEGKKPEEKQEGEDF